MINIKEAPIFSNSINRVIFIDKDEYIISYKHGLITNNYSDVNLDLGKFYLSKKQLNKDGKYTGYVTEERILANETVNQNVLNNDKFLISKIVNLLEGKINCNETFKIVDNTCFKIILHMKKDVNLIIFNCGIKENLIKDYNDILMISMRFYKDKVKLCESLDSDITEKEKKTEIVDKKYSNVRHDVEREESDFLQNICLLLNSKKQKIRSLQREIDGVIEDAPVEREGSKHNSSFRKEDDLDISKTYSLSDLI